MKRAGKLEKKEKLDKANKLYSQAFTKLEKARKKIKKIQIFLTIWGLHQEKQETLKLQRSFI